MHDHKTKFLLLLTSLMLYKAIKKQKQLKVIVQIAQKLR